MKLEQSNIEVHRSAKFSNSKFGVKNEATLFKLLRHNIYPNPIKTICQEIASNARDAHREIGNAHVPINIVLPNSINNYTYSVRDYGPSITPERMNEVFIYYGESTKKHTNDLTGGFGIGAKSPFAYVDQFTITSISPSDNGLVKRTYIAYIDETEIGDLSLLSEEETDEPQGTEISLSVARDDAAKFSQYTDLATRYWDVRPTINNEPWENVFAEHETIYDSDNIVIIRGGSGVQALIDGIPYPINKSILDTKWNYSSVGIDEVCYSLIRSSYRHSIFIKLNTGDVPVSASRDDLDYSNENTINILLDKIRNSLAYIEQSLKDDLVKKINECSTYYEAYKVSGAASVYPYNIFPKIYSGKYTWNNLVIKSIFRNMPIMKFVRKFDGLSHQYHVTRGRGHSYFDINFVCQHNCLVFYTSDTLSSRDIAPQIRYLFHNNPDVNYVIIVKFPPPVSVEEYNSSQTMQNTYSTYEKYMQAWSDDNKSRLDNNYVSQINIVNINSVLEYTPPRVKSTNVSRKSPSPVYYDLYLGGSVSQTYYSIDGIDSEKFLYCIVKNRRIVIPDTVQYKYMYNDVHRIFSALTKEGYRLIGVIEKYEKTLTKMCPDAQTIFNYVQCTVDKNKENSKDYKFYSQYDREYEIDHVIPHDFWKLLDICKNRHNEFEGLNFYSNALEIVDKGNKIDEIIKSVDSVPHSNMLKIYWDGIQDDDYIPEIIKDYQSIVENYYKQYSIELDILRNLYNRVTLTNVIEIFQNRDYRNLFTRKN